VTSFRADCSKALRDLAWRPTVKSRTALRILLAHRT
jgi:nucleoside-diphosphate-sugar epimerase